MGNPEERRKEHWHLSKSVPVSILLVQIMGALVFVTTLRADVGANMKEIVQRTSDRITRTSVHAELVTRDQAISFNSKAIDRIYHQNNGKIEPRY